jgi:anti-anti-sigma regulatory factor
VRRIERYDVSAIDRPTRADLEQLARLRLDAGRRGYDLELTGVGERLRLLLELTGLDEAFGIGPAPPEGSAQPGVPSA